jgi:hypothetical protein
LRQRNVSPLPRQPSAFETRPLPNNNESFNRVKQSAERISKVLGLANPLANYVNDDKQRNNQMGSGLTNQETPFL